MKQRNKQNAPKHSKSSAQQSEVIKTSPYAYFENKWDIDDDNIAHLHLNSSKDSDTILILAQLLQDSSEGTFEVYWDASGHKRSRYHVARFVSGLVVDDKTFWFGGPEMGANEMTVTRVDKSEKELWCKTIDLYDHVQFYCYAAKVDYMNLAVEIWETIKNDNGK